MSPRKDAKQRAINKLQAMSGGSRARSERDSGFSDASSEHTSTAAYTGVSEDVTRGRVPLHGVKQGSGSGVSQLAVVGGSQTYPNMIIMNNVLLKQQSESPKPLKPWGFSPAVELVQQPQVVFLQPVVSRPTAPSPRKDPASSRQPRPPRKYLPILKSYPKIAPHPGDGSSASGSSSSSSSGRGTASSSSSSSITSLSSSSRSKHATKLSSGHRQHGHRDKRHHHRHHHHRNQNKKKKSQSGGSSSTSGTPTAITTGVPVSPCAPLSLKSPLLPPAMAAAERETSAVEIFATSERLALPQASTDTAIAPSTAEFWPQSQTPTPTPTTVAPESGHPGPDPNPDPNPETKRMRFCNTYNILSKSGLLDITLRTKELLRLNQRTQSQLDRLREHTELLMQAWQRDDPDATRTLQACLREDDAHREEEMGEGVTMQETIEV